MTVLVLLFAAVLVAITPARAGWRPRPARGSGWSGRSNGRRRPSGPVNDGALVLDLVAAAGQAGMPVPAALIAAGQAAGGPLGAAVGRVGAAVLLGADPAEAWHLAQDPGATDPAAQADLALIRDQVLLVQACGAPGAALLHAAADGLRRRRRRRREAAAAALSVRLVLPMGLCALPAFLALSVVPVVLSLLGEVLG